MTAVVDHLCRHLQSAMVSQLSMADSISVIAAPRDLGPLTVGLCSLGQRLASPLVKSLWDVAEQTYPRAI